MLTLLLLLQLGADDGRGEGAPAVSDAARLETRVRGAIHFAGAGGFSGFGAGIGPGLSAEIGATWGDTTSLVLRLTVGTILVVHASALSVGVDFALSDHFSLGSGLALGLVGGLFAVDLPSAAGLFVPVRLRFAHFRGQRPRVHEAVSRSSSRSRLAFASLGAAACLPRASVLRGSRCSVPWASATRGGERPSHARDSPAD